MPDLSALLTAALDYVARGWPVFMLGRTKRPVANCPDCATTTAGHDREACPCLTCHGFYAATTDPDRAAAIVRAVPTGQLALRTGAASGVVVVDVDPAHGGRDSMNALIADGLLPPTAYVVTGSGGLHLYYRHPGQPVPCSQGKPGQGLGPGIDVKADGGYVVLPPSVHPRTGRAYRWAPDRAMEEMPPRWSPPADRPRRHHRWPRPCRPPPARRGASPSPTGSWPRTCKRSPTHRKAPAAPPSTARRAASRAWSPSGPSTRPTPSPFSPTPGVAPSRPTATSAPPSEAASAPKDSPHDPPTDQH
ncbi:bifunctional DNA primase/polymerase [Micromonospora maris AB-18-032]|nr:bifunctional DNA primase/polymerase [Micromonospora maris AB-18-032]